MSETILATEATIRLAACPDVLTAMARWEMAAPRRREIARVIRSTTIRARVVPGTVSLGLSLPIRPLRPTTKEPAE